MLDGRLEPGSNGGIEQALIGLASAFETSNLEDFSFGWLVNSKNSKYLNSILSSKVEVIEIQETGIGKDHLRPLIDSIRNNNLGDIGLSIMRGYGPLKYGLPPTPGQCLAWKPDLIHFPTQYGFETKIPNIYQPHDLQHLHFPQNFSRENLAIRKIGYSQMITQASKVVVGNEWTVDDVSRFFPDQQEHILNVPVFPQPLLDNFEDKSNQISPYGRYFFYPAGDWPHKNHGRLLQAFKTVVDIDSSLNLVLTGVGIDTSTKIPAVIKELKLQSNVFTLGYVSPTELAKIFKNAQCVVMPSLFESESLPIWEAFAFSVPVIASRTTAIPKQVGKAALLFNPESVAEISSAMKAILKDRELKNTLVAEGSKRLSRLTASNTAIGYRFAYRQALGLSIDGIDNEWLVNGFRF